jgi:hypothetical protein
VREDGAAAHRDALLRAAAAVVGRARDDGLEPQRLGPVLVAAWAQLAGPPCRSDEDFRPDLTSGVEALAFVVDGGIPAGGIVLRLPGELPDSFEAVTPPGPCSPEELRQAWFGAAPA